MTSQESTSNADQFQQVEETWKLVIEIDSSNRCKVLTTRRLSRTNTKIILKNSRKHSADLSKRNAGNQKGHRKTKSNA